MKTKHLCRIGAITSLLALSACGGGNTTSVNGNSGSSSSTYTVSATVQGLPSDGVTVALAQGSDTLSFSQNGTKSFATALASGASYDVSVSSVSSANWYCSVASGSGTISANVTATVSCGPTLGGIWTGTNGSDTMYGFSDEAGNFYFYETNGSSSSPFSAAYTGTGAITGSASNNLTAPFSAVAFAGTFSGGVAYQTGTVEGATLVARTSVTGSSGFSDSSGLNLTYEPAYATPSVLSTIAGTYTDAAGDSIAIDSNGSIQGTEVAGCAFAGTVSILNASYSVYSVSLAFSNASCTATNLGSGSTDNLNGLKATGLAALDNSNSTATTLSLGATVQSSSGTAEDLVYFNQFTKT